MQAKDAIAPEWHHLPACSTMSSLPHDVVHGPGSSRLHLHVYFSPAPAANASQETEASDDGNHNGSQQDNAGAATRQHSNIARDSPKLNAKTMHDPIDASQLATEPHDEGGPLMLNRHAKGSQLQFAFSQPRSQSCLTMQQYMAICLFMQSSTSAFLKQILILIRQSALYKSAYLQGWCTDSRQACMYAFISMYACIH